MITNKNIIIVLVLLFTLTASGFAPEIHDAAKKGDLEKVKALLEKSPKLVNAKDEKGWTPIHYAILFGGHKDVVTMLLVKGANVNVKDNSGQTPLLWAITSNRKEMVNLLIENSATVPIKGEEGRWMLHVAASRGYKRLVEHMISKGVDITCINTDGGTLLHSATAGGLKDIVVKMIEQGMKVNKKNVYDMAPLHLAASRGHKGIVELLINHGAEINSKDIAGENPFHLASKGGHKELVELLIAKGADQGPAEFPILKGEYLGQNKPGLTPELFAPGIISTDQSEHTNLVFSPDGSEVYWSSANKILFMKLKNGRWTSPQTAPFSGQFPDSNPALSPDGEKIYFGSYRPLDKDGKSTGWNLWVVEKKEKDWSEPKHLGSSVNTGNELGPSVTQDGTLYFSSMRKGGIGFVDIYRSKLVEGKYIEPENLGNPINSTDWDGYPYIAPNGSHLLFESGRSGGFGGSDLYISYRKKDGSWTKPKNLGNEINTSHHERFAYISPDGKYLSFASDRNGNNDVYWVDARIIDELKPKYLK